MGNQKIKGLPVVFEKNWSPVPNNSDLYRSNLTGEYVRKNFVKISTSNQIQEFRQRMKQTNPFICRVVFFHHFENDIYIVYTEETKNKLIVKHHDEWKILKKKILDAFLSLSHKYGAMRILPEMIGADLNNQTKIWINSNPAYNNPQISCDNQIEMIEDILIICKDMEEQSLAQFNNPNYTHNFPFQNQNYRFSHQANKNSTLEFINLIKINSSPSERDKRPRLANMYRDKPRKKPKYTCPMFLIEKNKQLNQQIINDSPQVYSSFISNDSFEWKRSNTENIILKHQNQFSIIRKSSQQLHCCEKRSNQISKEPLSQYYTISIKKQAKQNPQVRIQLKSKAQKYEEQQNFLSPKPKTKLRTQNSLDSFQRQEKSKRCLSNPKKSNAPKFLSKRRASFGKQQSPSKRQCQRKLNMTKKLRNVAYMSVQEENEERQNQINQCRELKQISEMGKNKSQSTVDSDLLKLLGEQEKKEYFQIKQKVRRKKQQFGDFCKIVSQLLSK